MRYVLGVEYDGSAFRGWQSQSSGVPTVQAVVEQALARVANHPVTVICAGRTDAGVHATGQVIHFDSDAVRSERAWVYGGNSHLPPGVAFLWGRERDEAFHARFSARRRAYRYVILNRAIRPAVGSQALAWYYRTLDVDKMQRAARALLGEHDFSAFRAAGCQAEHPIRTLYRLDVTRMGERIYLDVEANAFLYHMVRNLAGVLMAIGCGDQPEGWAAEVLAGRDRTQAGVTAPPGGLYLTGVGYAPEEALPSLPSGPTVW